MRTLPPPVSLALLATLCLTGCDPDGTLATEPDDTSDPADPGSLEFACEEAPIAGLPDHVCYAADLAYGPDERNRLDVFLVGPDAPLVIYFHGGGFTGGDKSAAWDERRGPVALELIEAGVSYASANYRLLEEGDRDGVLKPMGDAARALQWLRYHALDLDIDPQRVLLKGGSAGAGTALWLATHDELADPDSADPVERESTRVAGISISGSQSTYDVLRWESDVFGPSFPAFTFDPVFANPSLTSTVAAFYGLESVDGREDLETPEVVAYRQEVDMFSWMSADDPPIRIHNGQTDASMPADIGSLYHHGLHAAAVGAFAADAGIEVYAFAPAIGLEPADPVEEVEFILTQLGM